MSVRNLIAIVGAASLLALMATTAAPAEGPKTHSVLLSLEVPYYDKPKLEIAVGDTVVWRNESLGHPHSITDTALRIRSDDIHRGDSWSYTFAKAGVYEIVCGNHFFMRSKIIVRNPDGTTDAALDHPYQAAFKEFVIPVTDGIPRMIIKSKLDDTMWFTLGGGGFYGFEGIPAQNKVIQIGEHGVLVEYATPTPNGDGAMVGVDSLVMADDGKIWFTERISNRIGVLSRDGRIHEYQIPTKDGYALGVDIGPDGKIWFAERYGNRIGWISPDGEITEIELPEENSEPRTVYVDSRGRVWYTARVANEISYYEPASKRFVRLQIPTKLARPAGIAETSDGTIYFVEMVGNKIAKVVGDQIVEYPLPTYFSAPFKIVADANDKLWFTEVFGNAIGRFDPVSGRVDEFKIPTEDSRPGGLAIDARGRVWFTEQKGNKIGYLDVAKLEEITGRSFANSGRRASATPATGATEPAVGTAKTQIPVAPVSKEAAAPMAAAAPASPATPGNGVESPFVDFKIPTVGAFPGNTLVEDDDGWIWFPEILGNKIGAINIESHEFQEIELPGVLSMPVGLARDAEGLIWVVEFRGNKLARVDPANGQVVEFPLPEPGALPSSVDVDENGDVWITEFARNRIARFDRATGRFEEIVMPRPESGPLFLKADGHGSIWVAASNEDNSYLVRLDIATRRLEEIALPTAKAAPVGLLVAGRYLWVAEGAVGRVARYDTETGQWKEFTIPGERSAPLRLAQDKGGRIWITDGGGLGSGGGNQVAVLDPQDGRFEIIAMKQRGAKPSGILVASDGGVWFTQQGANRVSLIAQ